MSRVFREGSLSFRYPDNWQIEREDNDHGWTVSVYSPGTAFLTLTLDTDYPDSERVADTVLEAMRSEYPELEADERAEQVAGQWAVGHDLSFFSLDLTNTCWTRSFDCPDGTALLLCQVSDIDTSEEPVLRAICASLRIAGDD
ncbi:MAG TPA: hypothetical protein VKD72_31460 [Gemmataceae bacterium]|nr:hypothetical protein [Gemmataceae bacterium]